MQKMIEFKSGLKLVFVQNTAVRSVGCISPSGVTGKLMSWDPLWPTLR